MEQCRRLFAFLICALIFNRLLLLYVADSHGFTRHNKIFIFVGHIFFCFCFRRLYLLNQRVLNNCSYCQVTQQWIALVYWLWDKEQISLMFSFFIANICEFPHAAFSAERQLLVAWWRQISFHLSGSPGALRYFASAGASENTIFVFSSAECPSRFCNTQPGNSRGSSSAEAQGALWCTFQASEYNQSFCKTCISVTFWAVNI